jgi:hypothetical protein
LKRCNAFVEVNGPLSLIKVILHGQQCTRAAEYVCAHCGEARCSFHISDCHVCGRLACCTDNYQCEDSCGFARSPRPSSYYEPDQLNEVNSELGILIADLEHAAECPGTDLGLVAMTSNASLSARTEIANAMGQAYNDIGLGNIEKYVPTVDQNRRMAARVRAVLVVWGFKPRRG